MRCIVCHAGGTSIHDPTDVHEPNCPVGGHQQAIEGLLPRGWVCPKCGTVYAPTVGRCLCSRHDAPVTAGGALVYPMAGETNYPRNARE